VTLLRPAVSNLVDARPDPATRFGSWVTRQRLRGAIGVLWLIAGGLQLQPFMFTGEFASDVLGSAALSQPTPLHDVITSVEGHVAAHPAVWNIVFAGGELLIGAAMLLSRRGRLARVACASSVAFGGGVWIVGEGAGGLLTGHAALSTGAPGAALLYVVLTVASWPELASGQTTQPQKGLPEKDLPAALLGRTWILVWVSGAVLALLPAQRGVSGLSDQAAMGWMMSPAWATHPTHALASWLVGLAPWTAAAISAALALLFLAIAGGARIRGTLGGRAMIAGVVLALALWMFGQGFGGLSTGTATDVGTGPLLVLLAIAVHASRPTARLDEPKITRERR